jgi:catecholate siderophore receptor
MSSCASPFLALSCVSFIASAPALAEVPVPVPVPGAETRAQDGRAQIDRDDVIVTAAAQARPPALESPKATSALIDTPQTITVISDQTLRKQNLLTLRDALQTIPGITFGAGEGGGGYGDTINLRGFSANNDITIDGVRDSAQYSRTDPFNLQQIEVYNGANSVFNGSGSVGGTINLVSKEPRPEDLTIAQAAIGTDDYYRAAVDANQRVGDLVAVRLNGVYHRNDVPGRDVERMKRWGVAPAVTIGAGAPTSLTLAYVHQEDRNTPIYGIPYFVTPVNDGPLPGTSRSDYYGIVKLDRQDVTVDRLTATFRHAVNDQIAVRNLTRWQRVGQNSVTSAPQGTFCLAGTNRQPVTAAINGSVGAACPTGLQPGFWLPSGPRGLLREQENQLLFNQTDLRLEHGEKGGVRNVANIGVAGTIEDYDLVQASLTRTAAGAAVTLPPLSIVAPDTTYTGPVNRTVTAISSATSRNLAVYAFDTLELGRFFEVNGGVRWESNRATFRAHPLAFVPPGSTQVTALAQLPQVSRERLFSYRIGGVFHPVRDVSVYAGYGNARTPSSATVRLGCGTLATATAADPCAVAPETARNYEVGVKAGLFNRRLELTAAAFRNERSNFRVPSNDPALPSSLQVLDGRSRVDGIALGVSGNVTRNWTIFANYTYLDGRVRQSVSDYCRANPRGSAANVGGNGCTNSVAIPDPQAGSRLIQTPEHSGSLFTTYRLPFGLELGYGLTYQGSFYANAPVVAADGQVTPQYKVDDYLIHRAYLAYTVREGVTLQLNVQNLTDERYFTSVRNNVNATSGVVTGGWAAPGDRRQAVLSLFYSF